MIQGQMRYNRDFGSKPLSAGTIRESSGQFDGVTIRNIFKISAR